MYNIISIVWSAVTIVSTLITMIAIAVLVYAYVKLLEVQKAENDKLSKIFTWRRVKTDKHDRWEKVEQYLRSQHPSDWKMAILEADSMLDDIVIHLGYQGKTMGERMKQINANAFPHLDDAWEAHKVRNHIAHRGGEYPITRTEADDTIDRYHRVFKSLGYL